MIWYRRHTVHSTWFKLCILQRFILQHFHNLHTHSQMIKCSRGYWSDVNMSGTKVLILCDFILSDIPTSWLAFVFAYAVVRVGERFDQVWHEWLLQCCSLCAFMAIPLLPTLVFYWIAHLSSITLICIFSGTTALLFYPSAVTLCLWGSFFHAVPTYVPGEWCLECCTTAVSAVSLSCSIW